MTKDAQGEGRTRRVSASDAPAPAGEQAGEDEDEWTSDELSTAALMASSILAQHGRSLVRTCSALPFHVFLPHLFQGKDPHQVGAACILACLCSSCQAVHESSPGVAILHVRQSSGTASFLLSQV